MKKYVCPVCGKEFDSLTALKADITMHESEEKVAIKAREAAEELKKRQAKEKELKELEKQIEETGGKLITLVNSYNAKSTNKSYSFEFKSKQKKVDSSCAVDLPLTLWDFLNGKF
jgi:DNA repair exonuclease SbcCD ATPase subunit